MTDVTQLARQGNPQAIAALLNQSLQPKGIAAKVALSGTCLKIMLESVQIPDQAVAVKFIRSGMKRLAPEGIETVKLYGKRSGEQLPDWDEQIELRRSGVGMEAPAPVGLKPKTTVVVQEKPKSEEQAILLQGLKVAGLLIIAGWIWAIVYSRFQVSPETQGLYDAAERIDRLNEEARSSLSQSSSAVNTGITLSGYNQAQTGMTLSQVEAVLGQSGQEMSRVDMAGTPLTVVYMWQNSDGSNMNATFQGGELILKAQFGLK